MQSGASKYRRTSSFHVSPRADIRPQQADLASQAEGEAAPPLRMKPVDASLSGALRQQAAGGCEQNQGWIATGDEIIIFTVYPVALGSGGHADKPVVRCTIPLSDLHTQQPPDPTQITVLFPFALSHALPAACVVVYRETNDVFIVSLSDPTRIASYLQGHPTTQGFTQSPFVSAVSAYSRGCIVANRQGVVFALDIDPVEIRFRAPAANLCRRSSSTAGYMASFLSMATNPTHTLANLFLRGTGGAGAAATAQVADLAAILYNPVAVGAEGGARHVVYAISRSGHVVEISLPALGEGDAGSDDGEDDEEGGGGDAAMGGVSGSANGSYAPRVILESLAPILGEQGAHDFEVIDACITYPNPSLHNPVVNLLATYTYQGSSARSYALCRVVCGANPVHRIPVALGPYPAAEGVRFFIEEHTELGQQGDEPCERLVLVVQHEGVAQVVKVLLPEGVSQLQHDATASSEILGGAAVVSSNAAPQPEKLCVITSQGQFAVAPLCSLSFSAVRRSGCGEEAVCSATPAAHATPLHHSPGLSTRPEVPSSHLQLLSGDLAERSREVLDNPVIETSRWNAMTDLHDRTSTTLLVRVREKADQVEFILEAAARKPAGQEGRAATLRVVADHYEKAAVSLAMRELQTRLYNDSAPPSAKWQPAELVKILTEFTAGGAAGNPLREEHAPLHLTPVQTFYTEARRVEHFFPFFAAYLERAVGAAKGGGGAAGGVPPLPYAAFGARILAETLLRLRHARGFVTLQIEGVVQCPDAALATDPPAGASYIPGHRTLAACGAEMANRGAISMRWTHSEILTSALRKIVTVLASALQQSLQETSLGDGGNPEAISLESAEHRAQIRGAMRDAVVWIAGQEAEAAVIAADPGLPHSHRTPSLQALQRLKGKRAEVQRWVQDIFGEGGSLREDHPSAEPDAPSEPCYAYSKQVFSDRAEQLPESIATAREIAEQLDDYLLLLRLALLEASPQRLDTLRSLLRASPVKFFEAAVELQAQEGGSFEPLASLPSSLGATADESAVFRKVVSEMLPDGSVQKPGLLGPLPSQGGGAVEAEADAAAQLLRGARATAAMVSAQVGGGGELSVPQLVQRLKVARFSCESLPTSPERDAMICGLQDLLTPLQVQGQLLSCASQRPMPPQSLLNLLLAGPAEGGPGWDDVDPSSAVSGFTGHKLAWAFALVVGSGVDSPQARMGIWSKALCTPKGWWEATEYEGLLDRSEPEQLEALRNTTFYLVYRTVMSHPRLQNAAFMGSKHTVLARLQESKPATLPNALLQLLVEFAEMQQ